MIAVAPGTWRYALPPALAALPVALVSPLAAGVLVALAAAAVAFHRDPDRTPNGEGVLAPADGTVSVVRREDGRLRVGVFMNLDDVHVNRAPLPGRVASVTHSPGGHWPAFTKASDRNERVTIDCDAYTVVLIAGTVARRAFPYVAEGDRIERGQRIGHISFSSRVDLLFPPAVTEADLTVSEGDTVRAGETVIAEAPADLS